MLFKNRRDQWKEHRECICRQLRAEDGDKLEGISLEDGEVVDVGVLQVGEDLLTEYVEDVNVLADFGYTMLLGHPLRSEGEDNVQGCIFGLPFLGGSLRIFLRKERMEAKRIK